MGSGREVPGYRARGRGTCRGCGRLRYVTLGGRIDLHTVPSGGPAACAGSGQRPAVVKRALCEVCGSKLEQPAVGRPRTTCSAACRQWKHRGRDRLV